MCFKLWKNNWMHIPRYIFLNLLCVTLIIGSWAGPRIWNGIRSSRWRLRKFHVQIHPWFCRRLSATLQLIQRHHNNILPQDWFTLGSLLVLPYGSSYSLHSSHRDCYEPCQTVQKIPLCRIRKVWVVLATQQIVLLLLKYEVSK